MLFHIFMISMIPYDFAVIFNAFPCILWEDFRDYVFEFQKFLQLSTCAETMLYTVLAAFWEVLEKTNFVFFDILFFFSAKPSEEPIKPGPIIVISFIFFNSIIIHYTF